MNVNNPVIKLCQQGSEDEFRGEFNDACMKYRQAWVSAQDDYEACIAAHYVARCHENEQDKFQWNLLALQHAERINDNRIDSFWGSLYVNLGQSYERIGQPDKAAYYFQLAASHGINHQTL